MESFKDVRERARTLGIRPLGGKGVNAVYLRRRIAEEEQNQEENPEAAVKEIYPRLYFLLHQSVLFLPDTRDKATIEHYGPLNIWHLLFSEVSALQRMEAERDRTLIEMIVRDCLTHFEYVRLPQLTAREEEWEISDEFLCYFAATYHHILSILKKGGNKTATCLLFFNGDTSIIPSPCFLMFSRTLERTKKLIEKMDETLLPAIEKNFRSYLCGNVDALFLLEAREWNDDIERASLYTLVAYLENVSILREIFRSDGLIANEMLQYILWSEKEESLRIFLQSPTANRVDACTILRRTFIDKNLKLHWKERISSLLEGEERKLLMLSEEHLALLESFLAN